MHLNRRQLTSRLLTLAPIGLAARPGDLFAQPPLPPPPNVFISPCGQPFRAKPGAPYPVVDWFHQVDKNADGKVDRAEFNADAEAFFKILDINRDGFLSPYEVNVYELKIAPEVVGGRKEARNADVPRLWLAQFGGQGGGGGHGAMGGGSPSGEVPIIQAPPTTLDESTQGASPYSFFDEPEPVTAADLHFRGVVSKADFVTLSNAHFDTLDRDQKGYLTLDALPQTPAQRRLSGRGGHGGQHGRRRP